jgi:hypothetical protein
MTKLTPQELNERIEVLHKYPKELPQFRLDVKALLETFAEAITPDKQTQTDYPDTLTARWIEDNPHNAALLAYGNGQNKTIDTIQANTKELLG